VGRHPRPDRVEPCRHDLGELRPSGQDEGEGPRPEEIGEAADPEVVGVGHPAEIRGVGQVNDQRVEGRTGLDLEDAGDGAGIEGICAETVDRLGRKGDEGAVPEEPGPLGDGRGVVGGEDAPPHTTSGAERPG
jgi:hypothetical protein